jgi:hypothetical protein
MYPFQKGCGGKYPIAFYSMFLLPTHHASFHLSFIGDNLVLCTDFTANCFHVQTFVKMDYIVYSPPLCKWVFRTKSHYGVGVGVHLAADSQSTSFIWVSGLPLGPLTRFYLALLFSADNYFILLSKAPYLTRKRGCSLQCNHSLVRLLTPNNHTLPSHLRLCSLFIASYDSQGLRWRYSNPPPHGSLKTKFLLNHI